MSTFIFPKKKKKQDMGMAPKGKFVLTKVADGPMDADSKDEKPNPFAKKKKY